MDAKKNNNDLLLILKTEIHLLSPNTGRQLMFLQVYPSTPKRDRNRSMTNLHVND